MHVVYFKWLFPWGPCVVVAGTGWILGFIIRRPQTSLAAARQSLRATTGAVSRENGCHANTPTHHATLTGPLHWPEAALPRCAGVKGRSVFAAACLAVPRFLATAGHFFNNV